MAQDLALIDRLMKRDAKELADQPGRHWLVKEYLENIHLIEGDLTCLERLRTLELLMMFKGLSSGLRAVL